MHEESRILKPMNRRTFMRGMGAVAGALTLPVLFKNEDADAQSLTGNGVRMIRFAHLTDLHYTTRPQQRYPTSYLHIKRAVEDLNHQDLDFVVFTGDMFHFPKDVEREMPGLQDALKGLRHPYYAVFGNHDVLGDQLARRKAFIRDNLGDQGLSAGENYYTFSPVPGLRFVMLDSTDVDGDVYAAWTGRLSERQTRWLRETLTKHADETVFVALHHPPVTPYPFMDKLKFEDADRKRLASVLNDFPNAQMMLAGHYHFGGRNRFAHSQLLLGPSLVEHPHSYRVIEVAQLEKGKGAISYQWETLNLHGDEDHACAYSTAGLRSMGLMSMSYLRTGAFPVALPV